MKTRTYIPIVIAALSILSQTMNAQNTKQMNFLMKKESTLLAGLDRNSLLKTFKTDVDKYLVTMSDYIKFSPKTDPIEYSETVNSSDVWKAITEELKTDVKFSPNTSLLKYEQEMLAEEITNELKPMVKFNPGESMALSAYETENEFAGILKDLEPIVKYKPTIIP